MIGFDDPEAPPRRNTKPGIATLPGPSTRACRPSPDGTAGSESKSPRWSGSSCREPPAQRLRDRLVADEPAAIVPVRVVAVIEELLWLGGDERWAQIENRKSDASGM